MAKKKINTSKLDLGLRKKRAVKKTSTVKVDSDEVVKKIHSDTPEPIAQKTEKKAPAEPTRRVTLDIPVSLHKRIKVHVFELETTLKKYFLELAEQDLSKK